EAVGAEGAPGWLGPWEESRVDLVHGAPLRHVGDERGALHHAIHRYAVTLKLSTNVLHHLPCFGLNASRHETTGGIRSDLAGEKQQMIDPHRGREWPGLRALRELDER